MLYVGSPPNTLLSNGPPAKCAKNPKADDGQSAFYVLISEPIHDHAFHGVA